MLCVSLPKGMKGYHINGVKTNTIIEHSADYVSSMYKEYFTVKHNIKNLTCHQVTPCVISVV